MKNKSSHAVYYEDFGAVGDATTDDFAAIKEAHAYANRHGLPVIANPASIYYIGNSTGTAVIMTDTDWNTAQFIVDDSAVTVENRHHNIFEVRSAYTPFQLNVPSIRKTQRVLQIKEKIAQNLFVVAVNQNKRQFIRRGPNQDQGQAQTDCFILDKSGALLTPVIWDFDEITSLTAYPIDKRVLTVKGGMFTTIANWADSKYTYYGRGIKITRSNVVIDGAVHKVTGELDHGAPYGAFVSTTDCAYVTFKNCHLTGHKIYETIGSAGVPVTMGSYDISLYRSIGINFINCKQDNILDTGLWGIFGSNYCKDIVIDGCVLSRVDAHMGVTNLTVKNSTIGWMGIKAIGQGLLQIENVSTFCQEVVEFRQDYGSSWDGDLVIRNVKWYPAMRTGGIPKGKYYVITSHNPGGCDFGYTCSLPGRVTIENLQVMDGELAQNYEGVSIFYVSGGMNVNLQTFDHTAEHPYIFTSDITLRGLRTESGKGFSLWQQYPVKGYCPAAHNVHPDKITPNFRAIVEGIDKLEITSPNDVGNLYGTNHRLVPHISVRNCKELKVQEGAAPMVVTS